MAEMARLLFLPLLGRPDLSPAQDLGCFKKMQEFEKTVEKALNYAQENNDTLVIVTADHETGGLLIEQADARYRETGKMKITWNTAIGRGTHTGIMIPVFAPLKQQINFSQHQIAEN